MGRSTIPARIRRQRCSGRWICFFFQAEDGIRDYKVPGVQTCALPISTPSAQAVVASTKTVPVVFSAVTDPVAAKLVPSWEPSKNNVTGVSDLLALDKQIGRASCRERV